MEGNQLHPSIRQRYYDRRKEKDESQPGNLERRSEHGGEQQKGSKTETKKCTTAGNLTSFFFFWDMIGVSSFFSLRDLQATVGIFVGFGE